MTLPFCSFRRTLLAGAIGFDAQAGLHWAEGKD